MRIKAVMLLTGSQCRPVTLIDPQSTRARGAGRCDGELGAGWRGALSCRIEEPLERMSVWSDAAVG